MSKVFIEAWLMPESAGVLYRCAKPKKWDKMSPSEKITYFEEHMIYGGDSYIDENPDSDWYDSIDADEDFEEVEL